MQNRCRGDLGESNYCHSERSVSVAKNLKKNNVDSSPFSKAQNDEVGLALDSRESGADSQNLNAKDFNILVAKCGKTIGLRGEIRLIVYSDFSEIFTQGNVFLAKDSSLRGSEAAEAIHKNTNGLPRLDCVKSRNDGFFLTLQSFNPHKQSATFDEIQSIDEAKNLTSLLLYSSKPLSQKYCALGENEHFWFEIIGMRVIEGGESLGIVSDIERIGSVDYLIVAVDSAIFAKYPHIKAKRFYLPYISRYILQTDKNNGTILVQDSLGILENS